MSQVQTDRTGSVNSSSAIKVPCRVATTADLTPSLSQGALNAGGGGLFTIDGVALNAGDRVLVKNQTDQTTNGIWLAATTAWLRDVDAQDNRALVKGTLVLVTDGTLSGGLFFELTSANPITIGSSNITFAVTSTPTISGAMSPVVGAATLAAGRTAFGLGAAAVENLGGVIVDNGAGSLTIAPNGVTNALLAQMAATTLKGNSTGGTANASDVSVATVLALLMALGAWRGHLSGLTLSNDTTTAATVLDIAPGSTADSNNASLIFLNATFFKSVAGAWAAGAGSGVSPKNGMGTGVTFGPTGGIAGGPWFAVYAITNAGAGDVYIDNSQTAANAPASTTASRRVGYIKSDGSSHIIGFFQIADWFFWKASTLDVNAVAASATPANKAMNVPPGVVTMWRGIASYAAGAGAHQLWVYSNSMTDEAASSTEASIITAAANADSAQIDVLADTAQNVRIVADSATGTYSMRTLGFSDYRGRFS